MSLVLKTLARNYLTLNMKKNKFKRGDIRSDGLIFWSYRKDLKSGEYWVTEDKFKKKSLRNKEYYKKNREHLINKAKENYINNRERDIAKTKEYALNNKEAIREKKRLYRLKNLDEHSRRDALYYRKNRHDRIKSSCEYSKKRLTHDPVYRMVKNLRRRLSLAIEKGVGKKTLSTLDLTGCSWIELRKHLESQFKDGMLWSNYGTHGWHVDHIIPCSYFNLTLDLDQKKCFHYTNLQPLWAKDNLKKSNKI